MTPNYPIAIRVTAATKQALERAAAADGMSVAGFVEAVLTRALADLDFVEFGLKAKPKGIEWFAN